MALIYIPCVIFLLSLPLFSLFFDCALFFVVLARRVALLVCLIHRQDQETSSVSISQTTIAPLPSLFKPIPRLTNNGTKKKRPLITVVDYIPAVPLLLRLRLNSHSQADNPATYSAYSTGAGAGVVSDDSDKQGRNYLLLLLLLPSVEAEEVVVVIENENGMMEEVEDNSGVH